jgi:serine/threonine protein phosphatase PrpC
MSINAPNSTFDIDFASLSHTGHVRKFNEDSVFADARRGLWIVADGMGGHHDGNIASDMIVQAAAGIAPAASLDELTTSLKASLGDVNERLLDLSNGDSAKIVGSTVVALMIHEMAYACLWAGDSRCYLIRDDRLAQLSHDHTEVQELVDRGVISKEEAKTWPRRNVVTRAIGADHVLALDVKTGSVSPGDTFVLCSDGLTGHVDDAEILSHLQWANARQACQSLIDLALARGGKDNVSIIIVNIALREATAVVYKW